MSIVDDYLDRLQQLLAEVRQTQRDALDAAAEVIAQSLAAGGVVHLFGTGHSHMIAEEVFYRAGGLLPVDAMLDREVILSAGALRSTESERTTGKAAEIAARYDLRRGDAGVVISSSGRNPVPVEMAQLMRARGMQVIALTNLTHSRSVPPLDPPGLRLFEVADVVLDNRGAHGDAGLHLDGVAQPVGPTSTVIGAAIIQSVMLLAMEKLVARGAPVVNLPSANVDDADLAAVARELGKVRARVRHLTSDGSDGSDRSMQ
jgi:uncharacterized phosphosugar-binding protein